MSQGIEVKEMYLIGTDTEDIIFRHFKMEDEILIQMSFKFV